MTPPGVDNPQTFQGARGGEDGAAGVTFDGLLDTVNRLWINTLQFSLRRN